MVQPVTSDLAELESKAGCFSVSCNTSSSQISAHTLHIPCEASYVFGTGEDNLTPKSSIKRKHQAHCRFIATPFLPQQAVNQYLFLLHKQSIRHTISQLCS